MSNNANVNIRVLGVVGSPRRGGNTDLLVDKVLEGTVRAGAKASKIHLGKLKIAPCRACLGCRRTGRCVVKDDMQGVLDHLDANSIWVLGTPVYFWGPTGWFKAFMDRFYGAREHIDFSTKSAINVVPFENDSEGMAEHTVGMLHNALKYLKVSILADVVVPGVNHKGDVRAHPEKLQDAYRAGEEAVIQSSCRDATGCEQAN
ncbi:MAG: flavodoxin family protein [Candidatus Zixiibacteriota bacterium]|nr:MAG: flavodoxin family protein [candidate division Zixibacteria bacterium]